jgi:hypothetical protein
LIRLVELDKQVRGHLREMPPLNVGHAVVASRFCTSCRDWTSRVHS